MIRISTWMASCLWLVLGGLSTPAHAVNEVQVPADIQIALTASPTDHLVPNQPIHAVLTVTNLGPAPVQDLVLESAPFTVEWRMTALDCHGMVPVVADLENGGYENLLLWFAVGPSPVSQTTELDVGQALTCNMTLVLTSLAPLNYTLSFGLLDGYVDINPANDTGSVVLQQAIPVSPTVPATGILSLTVLSLLVGLSAAANLKRRRDTEPTATG